MDDLNDSLDDLLGGKIVGERPAPPAQYQPRDFTEPCFKCHGSKVFRRGNYVGQCFACKGEGTRTFKTSPEKRQAARVSAAHTKADRIDAWIKANPEVHAWLLAEAPRFEFAQSMLEAIAKYGSLTDGQQAACERGVERSKQRQVERTARVEAAPVIEVGALEAAFEKARNYKRLPNQLGVKRLQLRLDTFVFKPASKHPGTIYVTDKTEQDGEGQPLYLGKIVGGRFQAARVCGADREARVVAAAANPANAARAYGQRFGACSVCGRELTAEESIGRSMGPICAERFGF